MRTSGKPHGSQDNEHTRHPQKFLRVPYFARPRVLHRCSQTGYVSVVPAWLRMASPFQSGLLPVLQSTYSQARGLAFLSLGYLLLTGEAMDFCFTRHST